MDRLLLSLSLLLAPAAFGAGHAKDGATASEKTVEEVAPAPPAGPPRWNALMQELGKSSDPAGYPEYMPLLEQAIGPLNSGLPDEAGRLIAQAVVINPEAAIVLYFQGMSLTMSGAEGAEGPLGRAYALAGDNVEVARAYGERLANLKRFDEANVVFAKAWAKEPKYVGLSALWGQSLFASGRVEDGLAKLAEAAWLTPELPDAQVVLFEHLLEAGLADGLHAEAAQQAADRMERLGVMSPQRWEAFAVRLRDAGRFTESVKPLRKLLAAKPERGHAWGALADSLLRGHAYADAEQAAAKAVELGLDDGPAWYTWAAALWQQEKHDQAVEKMRVAVARDPAIREVLIPEILSRL